MSDQEPGMVPCDACKHRAYWHGEDGGCIRELCDCGEFQEPSSTRSEETP